MPSKLIWSILVLGSAVLYQLFGNLVFQSFGVLRSMQPLSDFPYACRRLYHEDLKSCEDIWLDEEGRALYATCSTPEKRQQWMPSMRRLNTSGRGLQDHVSVLNIDEPGSDGLFGVRKLKTRGYVGATGDQSLDLYGFDGEHVDDDHVRLYLANQRPSVDDEKAPLDNEMYGANSTVDVFEIRRGSDEMIHVKTIASPDMWSLNRIALDGVGGFYFTNDRTSKHQPARTVDYILGGGNVGHCDLKGICKISQYFGFTFPNGLVQGADGLVYVPSEFHNKISVMRPTAKYSMYEVEKLLPGMPIENLSVDLNGDIWAAGIPKVLAARRLWSNPYKYTSPSTIFRIQKGEHGYEIKKMLEDKLGEVVTGVTTVRHDVQTGRLFMSSGIAPYMMVCDPK